MTGERLRGILVVGIPKTNEGSAMTSYIARFGGPLVALIAVGVGVLLGRVIEAIAVAAVLYAVWTHLWRARRGARS